MPFSRPSTLKTENFLKIVIVLLVAYVHIQYSTYRFSEESKGGGGGNLRNKYNFQSDVQSIF